MNTRFLVTQLAAELQANIITFDSDLNYIPEESCPMVEGLTPLTNEEMKIIYDFLFDLTYPAVPLLSVFDDDIIYACCAGPDRYYLIGPVKLSISFSIRHRMKLPADIPPVNLIGPTCTLSVFLKSILWIQNLCCNHEVSENLILTENCMVPSEIKALTESSGMEFLNRENEQRHNSYYQEFRMLSSIEQGDLDLLEQCNLESPAPQSLGKLSKDPARNYKDISISVITLISRAAIRGGVHYETAFSLCDAYIMQIEEMKNLMELQPLMESAKTTFALMVHDLKGKSRMSGYENHPYIEKTKNYIYSHLHGKITLKDAADELKINPNYLSDLFRKYEGISFSDYVLNAKIELTKNLLIYSPYSYSEIAAYLGFASQSHLGSKFKAATQMTLQQYRRTYSSDHF